MTQTYEAIHGVEAAIGCLHFNDPVSDMLRSLQSTLMLRWCHERNAASLAAAYAAHEADIYADTLDRARTVLKEDA